MTDTSSQPTEMPVPDLADAHWHGTGDVQVAFVGELTVMRDRRKPEGSPLVFTAAEWKAFVLGARDGEFDLNGQPLL